VVNDAIKLARKQRRNVPLDEPAVQLANRLIGPDPMPEQLVEQREARELVRRAILQLSPEQRAVVVMRYFLEMSEVEMSTEMKRPLSTIKWWLREARKRLRGLIGPVQGVEDSR
jgi:RNA polymerase sigma-70 factor (ECF subfamily)